MRGTTHLMEQDICLRVGGESATTDYNFKMVDSASILYLDSPGAGTHTYKLILGGVPSNKWTITQCGRVYASSSYPKCSMIFQSMNSMKDKKMKLIQHGLIFKEFMKFCWSW